MKKHCPHNAGTNKSVRLILLKYYCLIYTLLSIISISISGSSAAAVINTNKNHDQADALFIRDDGEQRLTNYQNSQQEEEDLTQCQETDEKKELDFQMKQQEQHRKVSAEGGHNKSVAWAAYMAMVVISTTTMNDRQHNLNDDTSPIDAVTDDDATTALNSDFISSGKREYMAKLASAAGGLSEDELIYLEQHGMLEKIRDKEDGSILYRPSLLLLLQPFKPAGPNRYPEYKDGLPNSTSTSATMTMVDDLSKMSETRKYNDDMARLRRMYVRNAMEHTWRGYKTYAWGKDELRPLTKTGHDNWGGMGTTLVDSLDTLWLMGMKDEFWEARDWVRDHLNFDRVFRPVSVFETTIRNLGGLLSAYDLSGDEVFLEKADDLGARLISAFESPSGLPYSETDLNKCDHSFNTGWLGGNAVLSEMGTLQLEFRYLGTVTGNQLYTDIVTRAFDTLVKMNPKDGLYPVYVANEFNPPLFGSMKITFGALGDSFYEYMLKVWLQGGKKEHRYRRMYDLAMTGLHDQLLQKSTPTGLTYVADLVNNELEHKMDHLVCFLPGTLALGAYTNPNGMESPAAQRDLRTAKALAYTCYQMYASTKTGMAPEFVRFQSAKHFVPGAKEIGVPRSASFNILRPETAESLFVLYQLTGDNVYREWGWEIFRAIEEFCRTEVAYASLNDVDNIKKGAQDRMESFFISETLKYLYLLQDPDTSLDVLNKHIMNTEAHPLRPFEDLEPRIKGSFVSKLKPYAL